MQNDVFQREQEHLSDTWDRLSKMEKDLESRIGSIAEKAAEEKRDIRENLSLNFDGDSDSMETYIEFEVMNHAIDHYNIERDSAIEKLGRIRRLLKAPYFAKVRLRYAPDEEPEEYYIGSAGISENALEPLVIDWRSPVAETYYNQENGRTFYHVDGRRIEVELLLRRQFELSENHLHAFFDTQIALSDPLLIHSLTRQRTDKMQAITATIQKEQNAVVRHENVPVLLVGGIAGSGKTSVLLQRIAWLFYRQRDTLRPDEVVLMTLNPIFRRYIDQVLPDMGEMNPVSLTWGDFLSMAGVPGKLLSGQSGGVRTTAGSLKKIEEQLPTLTLEPEDLCPVRQKNLQILSAGRIAAVLASHENIPTGERLIQISIDELKEIAKGEIRRRERDEEREGYGAGEPSAIRAGEPSAGTAGDRPAGRAEDNRIRSQYGGAFYAINTCQWLNISRIGCRLLGKKRLTSLEWLYLKMLLTGQRDLRTRYVMVDEVQDYTPAQLMVLQRYYPRAGFMLLGDEFQAIREGTAAFEQIHGLFNSEVTELSLTTSYRSSPEITALFSALLPPEKQILVSSVQPAGNAPVIRAFPGHDDYADALFRAVKNSMQEDGLTAVICAGARHMERTASLLKDCFHEAGEAGDCPVPALHAGDQLPEKGVFLIPLAHAKGLEFDGVILPDADKDTYPDTPLSRHRLYTALSRATHRLTILAQGSLSELLPEAAKP